MPTSSAPRSAVRARTSSHWRAGWPLVSGWERTPPPRSSRVASPRSCGSASRWAPKPQPWPDWQASVIWSRRARRRVPVTARLANGWAGAARWNRRCARRAVTSPRGSPRVSRCSRLPQVTTSRCRSPTRCSACATRDCRSTRRSRYCWDAPPNRSSQMDGKYGDSTRSVKAVGSDAIPGTPVAHPPVPASTYHLSPDESEPLDSYGRSSNPTWRQLESALAELEGAASALAFGSGMAAITSALRVLAKPGTKLVVPADGYYQVRRYAREYLAPQGVTVVEAHSTDICVASSDADVVLAETPTNPGLDVVDLHRLAMTCRGRGATLVVDNTTATPIGQQPLSLG